ncbi:DnaB-like helicase N-terminal domain-containing protein [Rossellomorea sp. H39__3]
MILGAVLLEPGVIGDITLEEKHFSQWHNRRIFAAMRAVEERGWMSTRSPSWTSCGKMWSRSAGCSSSWSLRPIARRRRMSPTSNPSS